MQYDTEFVCKNESESYNNVGNDTSVIIKSENKPQYQSMQDTLLNTDDCLIKKHKKSKKTSKSLLSNTTLDEHTGLRKAVKRENSISLDSITETETKKRKKHVKKSKESDSEDVLIKIENEEKIICKTEDTISKYIKTEKEEQCTETETKKRKKHAKKSKESDSETVLIKTENEEIICKTEDAIPKYIKTEKEEHHKHIANADLSSNNLEDSVSKKHKKNKKSPMKMSDSESEGYVVKIKIEKQDSFIDEITNEKSKSQVSGSETQVMVNLNNNFKMPKLVKKEDSIKCDTEKEKKKSPKKYTVTSRDSPLKFIKIKNEADIFSDINNTSDTEKRKSPKKHTVTSRDSPSKSIKIEKEDDIFSDDKERKKSPKKHANMSKHSDSEIIIKSENIMNDSRPIKHEESQHTKTNTSATDSDSSNLDHASKKRKKKIKSDFELISPIKVKTENF